MARDSLVIDVEGNVSIVGEYGYFIYEHHVDTINFLEDTETVIAFKPLVEWN